ncbi:unnamed protein product, partial [Vitis vinifera]
MKHLKTFEGPKERIHLDGHRSPSHFSSAQEQLLVYMFGKWHIMIPLVKSHQGRDPPKLRRSQVTPRS